MTRLAHTTFCVIDLETTGLDPTHDRATEIAVVRYLGGEVVGSLVTLLNPQRPVPPKITELTGLSDGQLVASPTLDELYPTLSEFVHDAVVVGHNVRFDLSFLRAAAIRSGFAPLTNMSVDTMRLAQRLLPAEESTDRRLSTLAAALGLFQPSHRALPDVKATADLLHHLIGRWPALDTLADLAELPNISAAAMPAVLRLTSRLPRSPGAYSLLRRNGDVLRVGAGGDIRAAARARLGAPGRRGERMLPEVHRVDALATPTALEGNVLALRMRHALLPRGNRLSTMWPSYRYVRIPLADPSSARVVTEAKLARATAYIGPVWSADAARIIVEALRDSAERWGDAPLRQVLSEDPQSWSSWLRKEARDFTGEPLTRALAAHERAELVHAVIARQERLSRLVAVAEQEISIGEHTLILRRGVLHSPYVAAAGFDPPPTDVPIGDGLFGPVVTRQACDEIDLLGTFLYRRGTSVTAQPRSDRQLRAERDQTLKCGNRRTVVDGGLGSYDAVGECGDCAAGQQRRSSI